MKLQRSIFTYLTVGICYFSSISMTTSGRDNILSLTESYSEPKNIAFTGFVGGSSHYLWVLTVLDELKNRGHNVTFFTKDDSVRFGKLFPRINTVSIGPPPDLSMETAFSGLEESNSDIGVKLVVATELQKLWITDYQIMLELFKKHKIDTALCDFFMDACYDSAKTLNIPFIITSTIDITPESGAPYVNNMGMTVTDFSTEYQGIYRRFYDKFIEPFEVLANFGGLFQRTAAAKKSMGLNGPLIPYESWEDNIKLINSFFGLTPPRPLGSLVEQIGPILPRNYPPLTDGIENFLENRKKVVYVSFGQHSRPSQNTVRLLLTSLLENLESGEIDGIIWAVVQTKNSFPDSVKTSSNTIYSISKIFGGKYADILFEKWVPQMAVLLHPSTYIFISHGGVGSCVESMYAGKRMVLLPSFADQFGNAMALERYNVGVSVRTPIDLKDLTSKIKRMASDKDGKIKDSLKRMQAIVQIRSQNGPKIGADVVEEVAFSHINGRIPHRYAASRRLSFMRAHNLDLYLILVLIIASIITATVYSVKYLKKYYISKNGALKKTKTL